LKFEGFAAFGASHCVVGAGTQVGPVTDVAVAVEAGRIKPIKQPAAIAETVLIERCVDFWWLEVRHGGVIGF
jgi:hypothetical protein